MEKEAVEKRDHSLQFHAIDRLRNAEKNIPFSYNHLALVLCKF